MAQKDYLAFPGPALFERHAGRKYSSEAVRLKLELEVTRKSTEENGTLENIRTRIQAKK